jgi:beta-lactamase superfamily II metal-dependent hydrolase
MATMYLKKMKETLRPVDANQPKVYAIWGDRLEVEPDPASSSRYIVHWRVSRTTTVPYRIAKSACQPEPLLEMIFLDVGQGDGCVVSVPDGSGHKIMVVDAGERSNMSGYLRWRFRFDDELPRLHAAVITHPDKDHYAGFQAIFDNSRISFDHVYHNGLLERANTPEEGVIGAIDMTAAGGKRCLEVFATHAQAHAFYGVDANRAMVRNGRRSEKLYPKLLWTALSQPARFGSVTMLGVGQGEEQGGRTWMPGFAPASDRPAIEVVGPVPINRPGEALALPAFGPVPGDATFDVGKTKNGNSVLLRLTYRKLTVLFGGDLNRSAEDYLLRHYAGMATGPLSATVTAARQRLSADILKCCHHGSADVTDEFVQAANSFAFVVSSGDEESHVHPRPEIIGLLGRHGRGKRPLVLSTELLRSTPEKLVLTDKQEDTREALEAALNAARTPAAVKDARRALTSFWNAIFRRLVTVYGAITVRSDGNRLLIAFRKEAGRGGSPWQLYEFEHRNGGWVGGEDDGGH